MPAEIAERASGGPERSVRELRGETTSSMPRCRQQALRRSRRDECQRGSGPMIISPAQSLVVRPYRKTDLYTDESPEEVHVPRLSPRSFGATANPSSAQVTR